MIPLTNRANYKFGDDPDEDRNMIRNLTGMMRTLIEDMAQAWALKSSQPEPTPEPDWDWVVTVKDTNYYEYMVKASDTESAIEKVRTRIAQYGIEEDLVDGETAYEANGYGKGADDE